VFVAIYRWRVKPDREAEFQRGWSAITARYVERFASGGSALFRGADGIWFGIARWQSREARAAAFAIGVNEPAFSAMMREAVLETLPDFELDCVDDQWVFPMPNGA